MRKIVMFLLVAALPLLAMPQAASAAAAKPTEQELLLIKKKKAEAARKAGEKKPAAKASVKQKTPAKKTKTVSVKQKPKVEQSSRAAKVSTRRVERQVISGNCRGFLGCLFGKKRTGTQRASTGGAARDYATAEMVSWPQASKYAPGSLVVQTPERSLYLVMGDGQARRYKVGVGREGFQWSGNSRIVNKAVWPTWRPPQVMIEREAAKGHILPAVMEGGPENPLGARALYIGGTMYRIHGTNNAASIGGAVSSGCIRMMNTDVIDLYNRVNVGARVYVYQ
ncbi:L,D-transpeptidase [Aestuariivirga sp.]|uniref:L,D-transpeptidase n=1 Tax=Aestuariivirga sp. TaxID=2650926 RepID=UPI0035942EF9